MALEVNSLLIGLVLLTVNNQPSLVQGKPFVLAVPPLTIDQIKTFFSSLTNTINGKPSPLLYRPRVNQIISSCMQSFTKDGELIVPTINGHDKNNDNGDVKQLQMMNLTLPYFLYSSDNQTVIFSHVFDQIKSSNSPCPVNATICDSLASIVTKDAPMNYVIVEMVDNYWQSCMDTERH